MAEFDLLSRIKTMQKQMAAATSTPKPSVTPIPTRTAPPPVATPRPPVEPAVLPATGVEAIAKATGSGEIRAPFEYKASPLTQEEFQTFIAQDCAPKLVSQYNLDLKDEATATATANLCLAWRTVLDFDQQLTARDPNAKATILNRWQKKQEAVGPTGEPAAQPVPIPGAITTPPVDANATFQKATADLINSGPDWKTKLQTDDQRQAFISNALRDNYFQTPFEVPKDNTLAGIFEKISGGLNLLGDLPVVGPSLQAGGSVAAAIAEQGWTALGIPKDLTQAAVGGKEDLVYKDGKWEQSTGAIPSGMPGAQDVRGDVMDISGFVLDPSLIALGALSVATGGTTVGGALMLAARMMAGGVATEEIAKATNRYLGTDINPKLVGVAGSIIGPGIVDVLGALVRGAAKETATMTADFAGPGLKVYHGTDELSALSIAEKGMRGTESVTGETLPGVRYLSPDRQLADSYAGVQTKLANLKGAPVKPFVLEGEIPSDLKLATRADVDAARVQAMQEVGADATARFDPVVNERVVDILKGAGFQGVRTNAPEVAAAVKPMTPLARVAPPANETEFAAQLQEPGWVAMEAGQNTDAITKQIADNRKLVKDLTAQGYDAEVGIGTYGGKDGQMVFVHNMSIEDATRVAAAHGQESIFTNEGQLYVTGEHTGYLHPMDASKIEVGVGTPPPDNYTLVHLADGEPVWFSGAPDFERMVPRTAEAVAAAGRPKTYTQFGGRTYFTGGAMPKQAPRVPPVHDEIGLFDNVPIRFNNPINGAPQILPYATSDVPIGRLAPELLTAQEQGDLAYANGSWQRTAWDWATKHAPGLKRFQIPFNPYASGTEPLAKPIVGYNRYLESAQAADTVRGNAVYAAGLGRLGSESGQLSIELQDGLPAAVAKIAETRAPEDIMRMGTKWFKLTPQEERARELMFKGTQEVVADVEAVGVDVPKIEFAEGEGWFHRQNIGQYGVEKATGYSTGAGRPILKPGSFMTRFNVTQGEFILDGGIVDRDIMGVYTSQLRTLHKLAADKQLMDMVTKLGVPVKALIPGEVANAPIEAAQLERWTRSLSNNLKKQIGRPGSKVPFRTPQMIGTTGQIPPEWIGKTADQVKEIVTRYTKLSKTGKMAAQDVRAMSAELKPIQQMVDDRLAIMRGVTTKARAELATRKDMIKNAMVAYQRTPTAAEMDSGVLDAGVKRATVPAEVFRRSYEAGSFPENSFAIGRLSSARWPMFSQTLFPKDITDALEKVYDTGVNQWLTKARKVVDMGRAMEAGFDLNFPFIQGIFLAGRDPEAWAKAVKLSYATVANPNIARTYMAKQMQLFPGAFKAFINDVSQIGESEFFLSTRGEGYLSKIPGLRHAAGRMGEAFDQFLDIGKWEWYKSMYPTVSARYGNAGTHELGAAIRNAMGTTSTVGLGVHGSQRAVETFLMFAPRYTRSVFALLSDAVSGGIRGSEARRAIGGLMASAGLVYTAAAHAADQEPDFNPMSSGFMSIRVGDNYIGIPGIARALMGTVTRSINAAITDPSVFYDPRRVLDDPVVRFFQSRTAAGVSDFFDIMIGKDYIGQPTRSSWQDLARVAQGFISPFGIGSWMEVRGDMATHMSVSVASFLLGRTTPVSPSALRNEHVYAWAKGLGVQLTDLNGTKFTPSNYGDLPRYLKDEFDVYAPQDTKRVADWRESNRNVLTEVDQAREQGFSAIAQAGMDLTNQNNAKAYGDFQLYQNRVSTILGDEARTISDYYNKHPFDQTAITKEQQTILDYNNKVLSGPGVQDAFGNIDWNLENVLERQFYQANPEARDIIMRQYTSAMDPIDTERRKVNWFLQDTYYAYMDSIWSPDGMAAFVEPASKWTDSPLPSLGDGRGPLDFGSAVEYQREMDYEFYKQFSDTGIPAALANFPSGGQGSPTVGQLYGVEKPLPVPLAQQATVTIRSRLMKDYWAFNDAIATDYLAQPQNAEILSDMRIWKKTDLPAALEEALTGYTPKKGPAPAAKGTSGAAGLFMP